MLKRSEIDQFYLEVEKLDLKFPVAAIGRATGESKGNVSKILSRKLDPSESFLKRFYDKFPKSIPKVSRETVNEAPADYMSTKDDLIAALKRENARLQKDLDLSLGELRHNVLLTRAMSETTQELLIELLVKQNKKSWDDLAADVGIKNGEKYVKLKEEGNFSYVGK